MTETEIYKMKAGKFAGSLAMIYAKGWIVAIVLLAVAALLAGIFFDLRWGVVFLMIVFLVAPMILAFLYIFHGMRPLTALNVAPHKITFGKQNIAVTACHSHTDPETGEAVMTEIQTKSIPHGLLQGFITGQDYLFLLYNSPEKGFLWLPLSAFSDPKDFETAIKAISKPSE